MQETSISWMKMNCYKVHTLHLRWSKLGPKRGSTVPPGFDGAMPTDAAWEKATLMKDNRKDRVKDYSFLEATLGIFSKFLAHRTEGPLPHIFSCDLGSQNVWTVSNLIQITIQMHQKVRQSRSLY